MRAVDTNVLVRLLTRDDAKQVAVAEAFVAKGAWVPHLALAEAMWVLAAVYERGASEIAAAVERLTSEERTGMGRMFKAIGFSHHELGPLPGF